MDIDRMNRQELAREYAKLQGEIDKKEKEIDRINGEIFSLKRILDAVTQKLTSNVGGNIPVRVYELEGKKVLLVKFMGEGKRSVEILTLESTED
jgi:hypothetical protein